MASCADGALRLASRSGQAMIEFAVALVVIIVLVAGLIQIGKLTHAHTQTMTAARGQAAGLAMASGYFGVLDAQYIQDWDVRTDGKRYTRDDEPIPLIDPPNTTRALTDTGLPEADQVEIVTLVPTNALSTVGESDNNMDEFFLVRGYAADSVATFPVIQNLIYNQPTISVESYAWLTWTEGIY